MKRSAFVCIAMLLLGVPAADAQPAESDTAVLTLEDAIARGLAASHRVGEIDERRSAAEAAVAAREAAERPQIALLGGYTRTSHIEEFGVLLSSGQRNIIFPDIPDNYRARLDVQWPLYTAGRTASLARAAGAEVQALERDRDTAAADLRLEITRAYWNYVTTGETERVVGEALRRMDAHLAVVRDQLQVGLIPPNDVLAVEAQRSRQELMLLEARNAREISAADLRRLVGLEPAAPLAVAARLDAVPGRPAPSDALIAEALKQRHERQALEARARAFDERASAARAGKLPTMGVAGGVDYARPNPRILPRRNQWNESWDASVNVSWLLWDGGRIDAEAAEAHAHERAIRQRLAELDSIISLEVRQRRLDLDSAIQSIAVAEAGVRSAAEARRVVGNRFEAGVAASVDVLDAQVALLQAELDRTRALASVQIANARLERAMGR